MLKTAADTQLSQAERRHGVIRLTAAAARRSPLYRAVQRFALSRQAFRARPTGRRGKPSGIRQAQEVLLAEVLQQFEDITVGIIPISRSRMGTHGFWCRRKTDAELRQPIKLRVYVGDIQAQMSITTFMDLSHWGLLSPRHEELVDLQEAVTQG